jgi:hypothetical protein
MAINVLFAQPQFVVMFENNESEYYIIDYKLIPVMLNSFASFIYWIDLTSLASSPYCSVVLQVGSRSIGVPQKENSQASLL